MSDRWQDSADRAAHAIEVLRRAAQEAKQANTDCATATARLATALRAADQRPHRTRDIAWCTAAILIVAALLILRATHTF